MIPSRVTIFPLALVTVSLLSLLLLLFPWSLSTQTSGFSLSLDLDNSEGDQTVSSLDVFPNRTIPIQIFGTDIAAASDLSLRFEFDPTQVAYEGFKRSNIVSGTSALTGKDFANIGITLSDGTAISGLIGTIRFRTSDAFSGTDIRLVRARLVREGQTETVPMDLSITLRIAKPPSPDFDRSGTVGIPDFLLFVDAFGSRKGQEAYEAKYDLDVNGEIGIPDFLIFVDSFGKVVNRAPVFTSEPPVTRSVDENTPSGQPIGDPILATDGDGDTLTYRLSGADADSFAIEENAGHIQTKGTYNFEQQDKYSVTVHVSDGEGGEASLVVGIAINDIDEPPGQPAPPRVSAIASTTLTVIWTEPSNTGPEITDYDVQYRQADSDEFIDANYDGTGRTVRLRGLFSSTRYAIQVRATNEEGTSEWSESGEWKTSELLIVPGGGGGSGGSSGGGGSGGSSGSSGGGGSGGSTSQPPPSPPPPPSNKPPTFDDGSSTTRSLAENTTGIQDIGNSITATDPEGTTVTYRLAGGDTDQFTIDTNNGQLRTQTGVDYNYEEKNRYSVTVEAADDQGGRATITVTINITDDDNERPERPDRPSVTASTLNNLSIRWTAPANTGPNIKDYDVQYRESGGTFAEWQHNGPGTSTTITSLNANTSYEVQVLARSPEGQSQWSESVTVSTVVNQAPTFNEGSSITHRIAENTTGTHNIGNPVTATDSDGGTLTYSLEGTDRTSFAIDGNQLQTRAGVTYDYEKKDRYEVTVRVEDGQGGSNTIEVTINLTDVNEAPTFTSIETFKIPENYQYINRVNAEDVDNGDDITGYTITGGADRNEIEFTNESILIFKDVSNFENPTDAGRNNEYIVVVTATGGTGGRALTAAQTITITVTDKNEPPGKPDRPVVSNERENSLTVTWTEPTNTGPDITDYDVQYRQGTSGAFTDVNYNGTGTTTTLTGLNPNTMYQVRVWAKNAEGTSKWSNSGQGTTTLISENQPAVPVGKLADRTLRVGDVSGSVEVAGAFHDPEGNALTYGATSSAPAVATVSLSGTRVTITPVAEGQATVTVTAIDKDGSNTSAAQPFAVTVLPITAIDYDTDDDGLIEITTLAQLNAVRHDLNGDGIPTDSGRAAYDQAFTDQVACGGLGCTGYELSADLDFDTNGSGDADAGDTYWNDGAGWVPIGGAGSGPDIRRNPFLATFEGNGHTIANLFFDTRKNVFGFFGYTGAVSVIRNVGLTNVHLSGKIYLGGLVGDNRGIITNCYVTGSVSGDGMTGGLVGDNYGPITDSYVSVSVSGNDMVGGLVGRNYDAITNSYTTRSVSGDGYVGGLVGNNYGPIAASYATGHVSGRTVVGGLVGRHRGTITACYTTGRVSGGNNVGIMVGIDGNNSTVAASYATGRISGDIYVGGLVNIDLGTVVASYYDLNTSGPGRAPGEGQTTTALQEPTNYSGIYQTWNRDLDSDGMTDDPWAFGTATQYPVLAVDFNGDGQATWQEFGYQLREGPTLTATATTAQVALSWTAVDASFWTSAPDITYTLTRYDGTTDETLAEETSDLQYTDTDVTAGATYTYQVAAVVAGGEATHSTLVSVTVPDLTD